MSKPRRKAAFTLVEILMASLVAALLTGAIVSFFGDSLQRFTQHEDTLVGVRDLQLLMARLRADLSMADGEWKLSSSSSQTGTTFPKEYVHLCHSSRDTRLHGFRFMRVNDDCAFPPVDPLTRNLPDTAATKRLLERISYAENAAAWVLIDDGRPIEARPRLLHLNVRDGGQRKKVLYLFEPSLRRICRISDGPTRCFAPGAIDEFVVRPMFEFLTFPDKPERTAEFIKVFYEIVISIKAEDDGGRIRKRRIDFTTKVTPRLLNMSLKSLDR